MDVILHIGQSKTGTTAIQSVLGRNRNLLSKHKILYPDISLKGMPLNSYDHNVFANALNDVYFYPRLTADEYWSQFIEQFNSGDYETMLLSGESFFGGAPYIWDINGQKDHQKYYTKKIKRLSSYLKGCNTKIILYLRPQEEWLESAIPHTIRYEGTTGKKLYQNDEQMLNLLSPCMDFYNLVSIWEDILKPEDIKISEYNRQNFSDGNIVADFLEKINISDKKLNIDSFEDDANQSWSREFIEIKKILNQQSKHRVKEDTTIQIINDLNNRKGKHDKYRISEELKQKTIHYFEVGNKKLSNMYNNGNDIFTRVYQENSNLDELSRNDINIAMDLFKNEYNSIKGRKIILLNAVKRMGRKLSPFIYSFCSSQWKKIKSSKS